MKGSAQQYLRRGAIASPHRDRSVEPVPVLVFRYPAKAKVKEAILRNNSQKLRKWIDSAALSLASWRENGRFKTRNEGTAHRDIAHKISRLRTFVARLKRALRNIQQYA